MLCCGREARDRGIIRTSEGAVKFRSNAHTDNVARHGIGKGGKEGRAYEQVTGCMQAARSDSLSHSPLSHLASKRGAPAAENGKQCNKGAKTRPISHLITHDASDSES